MANRHFASIDGFRGLGTLFVMWHHAGVEWRAVPLFQRGPFAISMFFTLSGFLIVTLLLREGDRHGSISLKLFYVRRTLRILPLYYGLLLVVAAYLVAREGLTEFRAAWGPSFFACALYLSNWQAPNFLLAFTWSLAAEEQFYLAWPTVERFGSRRWRIGLALAIVALSSCLSASSLGERLARALGATPSLPYFAHQMFTPILLGVLLAHALHSPKVYDLLSPFLASRWSTLPPLGAVVLLGNQERPLDAVHTTLMFFALVWTLATWVAREDHLLAPLLRQRILVRFGEVSYGMYLFHLFFIDGARNVLGGWGVSSPELLFGVSVPITALAAEISYRFYELPFLRLKNRFAR